MELSISTVQGICKKNKIKVDQSKVIRNIHKYSKKDLDNVAVRHDGKCLSDVYTGVLSIYEWQCANGHIWKANFNNILNHDQWCQRCYFDDKIKKTAGKYLEKISVNGGKFIESIFDYKEEKKYGQHQMVIKCDKNHTFKRRPDEIEDGIWCPDCFIVRKTLTIEYFKKEAIERGMECLSEQYGGIFSCLKFKCHLNHIYETMASTFNQGHGCPQCAGQGASSQELEIFMWVKERYPTAQNGKRGILPNKHFELDIYIEDLKKAIEFDGTFWHSEAIENVSQKDARKNQECKDAGIDFFRIPEKDFMKDKYKIKKEIFEFLESPNPLKEIRK